MKQSNTLQKIQYLNYITGIPVLYKILKKIHNTGKKIILVIAKYRRSANYHYNGKSVCIFQIKAFYLKKLHFNCTFSLDPVSMIYNYKQGFEEMI